VSDAGQRKYLPIGIGAGVVPQFVFTYTTVF